MANYRLAARYAKSLLDFAVEQNNLEQVYADMQWLQGATEGSREFVNLLRSPIIKSDKKNKIVTAVTNGHVGPLTMAFLGLLINKARESNLPQIIVSFIEQYKEYRNIHTVNLTTATPISEATRQAIVAQVKSSSGYEKIELVETVDPKLIGGFVLQMGDKLVDASVAYDLKTISRQFDNNDFVYKIR